MIFWANASTTQYEVTVVNGQNMTSALTYLGEIHKTKSPLWQVLSYATRQKII